MSSRFVISNPFDGVSANALGAIYMVIGSLGYVVNDALIRVATDEGLDVYQALCLRGIAMSVLFAGFVRRRRVPIVREQFTRSLFTRPLIARVGAEVVGAALFFAAIVRIEFATAQTILLLVPFAVTLAAALFLGEAVTTRHYLTVAVGFVGVLFVVQPGTAAFSPWSLAVVAAAAAVTVREFATRGIDDAIPASFIAFITAVAMTVMTGGLAVFTGWNPVTPRAAVVVAAACLCLIVGYVFTIQTVRVGDLSISAPFRYTTLLGAVVLGYVFFNEIPNELTIAGCAIILASGVYAVRLERAHTLERDEMPTAVS